MQRQRNAPVSLQYVHNVPSRALAVFIKHFQWKIMGQLKPKKRNTTAEGKILIPLGLYEHLKFSYNVTGAFKPNNALINSLSLKNIRYFNETDFCSVDIENISVRVGRTRKVHYKDTDLQKKELCSGLFLFSYRFNRFEGKKN